MNGENNSLVAAQLPPYEHPPQWIPPHERAHHPDYNSDLRQFLPRMVILHRNKASEQLGFNIRGGKEHHCGIYVSKVMANSEADRLGLREADQCIWLHSSPILSRGYGPCSPKMILTVNKTDFEDIDHADAVKVLKMNTTIEMVARYFPYGYDKTYDKSRYLQSQQQQYR